jgi:alpha-N-arabinofuranosidase
MISKGAIMIASRFKASWATVLVATWAVGTGGAAETASLVPPVLLPNGQEFKTWEVPVKFSRTYYVNQSHPKASDDNPGTEPLPFRTVNRAAQVLQPGERVVVAAGVYRERVSPARGGTGPDRTIGYEAAPGARVILSGSRVLTAKWVPSDRADKNKPVRAWMTTLPGQWFARENPFREVNLTDQQIDKCMDWAIPTKGKAPNTLRRGLVFQNGQRLIQVGAFQDLSKSPGSYWVEGDGLKLHLRPLDDADPSQARFEVTTQGLVFAPEKFGLGYIRVKGLTVEHSGNCFPRPQQGALSTMRGHHWIIEDNTVRQCNSIGIDIGDQFDTSGPRLAEGGRHVVRRNTITDCGIGGLEGKQIEHTLIEENVIRRCGWQRAQLIWETGGIKVHTTLNTLIRKNLIRDTIDASGIWMDWQNRNSRCTQNVIVGARTANGGIFMEASQVPNLVDHNVVWDTTGSGIYQHDCDELTIVHNLVGRSSDAGVRMQICQNRMVGGRLSTAKRNKILGNILVDNGSPLAISDPENTSDWNVFGRSRKPFDLAQWRKTRGWDEHSVAAAIEATLDPESLELAWFVRGKVPACPRIDAITHDFFNQPRLGETTAPGPLLSVPSALTRVGLRTR